MKSLTTSYSCPAPSSSHCRLARRIALCCHVRASAAPRYFFACRSCPCVFSLILPSPRLFLVLLLLALCSPCDAPKHSHLCIIPQICSIKLSIDTGGKRRCKSTTVKG